MYKQGKQRPVLVPITLNGATIRVDANSIQKQLRTPHHGDFKGTQVESPESFKIGESVICWPEAGKSRAVSMTKAAAGVFAKQFLESEGCTVTMTAPATA